MRRWWFLVLLLASAAAFLGLGLWSLWRSARSAEDRAMTESRQAAMERATTLARLVEGDLGAVDGATRFTLDGTLVIPPDVAWLEPPPPADVSPQRIRVLHEVESLDAAARPDEAAAILRGALASSETDDEDRGRFAVMLAFRELRAGRRDEAEAVFSSLVAAAPVTSDLAVGRLLLAASLEAEPSEEDLVAVARQPVSRFRGVLFRLGDSRLARELATAHGEISSRRAALRRIARHGAMFASSGRSLVLADEGDLLLYWPGKEGRGSGLLVDPATLLGALGLDAGFHVGPDAPSGAVPAIPLVAAVPRAASMGAWAGGGRLALLLTLLAATFVLGLLLTLRAVRREALAARTRAEFLTSVTHELKTPLASIRLLSEMLEEGRVPDEARRHQYHRLLSGEAARLSMLIENVLDLRRLERGERAYDKRVERLDEIVSEAVRLFRPVAEKDGIELAAELEGAASVAVDRGAVVQAMLNVMENARKYARSGKHLDVTTARNGASATVTIRDRGPGIAPAERESVFERFQRGQAQADGRVPGVGLGLHLARRILRDHGGDLMAVDPPEGTTGACIVATLPLTGDEDS